MRNYFIIILLLSGITFMSCKKDEQVTACMTSSKSEVFVQEVVNFTNCSEGATRFEWDFGDGNTSSIGNPSHKYESPGSYTIRFTAYGADNSSDTKTMVIKAGHMQITKVTLNKIELPTAPDQMNMQFQIMVPNTSVVVAKTPNKSISRSQLPYSYAVNWELPEGEWQFALASFNDNDILYKWVLNPNKIASNNEVRLTYKSSSGANEYDVTLTYILSE